MTNDPELGKGNDIALYELKYKWIYIYVYKK